MIPQAKRLPFYGKPGFMNSLRTSSRIRRMHPLLFLIKKIINHILTILAYSCPINSWRVRFHRIRGVKIGKGVFIGMHVTIDRAYPEYIIIEDEVMIAGGNHLLAHSRSPVFFEGKLLSYVAPVHLKKNAWLGINSIVLPGCSVGEGTVVTAGSVLTDNTEDNVIVRGNPAEVIKRFK